MYYMNERSKSSQSWTLASTRTRAIMMDCRADPRDRISALPDELLHVTLSFLDDARDITRTAVLSHRWRHVWVHAKNLNFCSLNLKNCKTPGGFPGFVDWVLAHRGKITMDSLVIWMTQKSRAASPEQINDWLRYAGRHVLKSLRVHKLVGGQTKDHKAAVVLLPTICRTSCILLSPSNNMNILQLPALATASYEALTELYLYSPSFSEEGPVLGDFVTSCCHSLRRLSISCPKALFQLVLRSEALQELEIYWAFDMRTLDVTAPNLRVVRLDLCFRHNPIQMVINDNKVARIVAPRLEVIRISYFRNVPRPEYDIHDLTSVRRLENIQLDMHGKYCHDTDQMLGLWFLAKCPGVQHDEVKLEHHWESDVPDKSDLVDLTKEGGNAAPFANVKSMFVTAICGFPAGHLVSSIASLLISCSRHLRLLRLSIPVITPPRGTAKCFCDDLEDKWEIPGNIALEQLEDVIMTRFAATDEEMQLLSLLFESSNSIRCVAICTIIKKIDIAYLTRERIGKEVDGNTTSVIGQKLMNLTCADQGRWYFVEQVYIWTRHATQQGAQHPSPKS